ncbi:MAG: hypothetical protein E7447_03465 [Ruminococcaceae bacterium]|nr:hypothetical protein [Oscillospiraceae bacterium]
MLYVTTRNKFDTYTANWATRLDRGPDGGLFLPFRMPELSQEELQALPSQSFCQRVATLLNCFFGTQLTGWDVELYGGKKPVKLVSVGHRVLVAELWHNHDQDYARFAARLAARISDSEHGLIKPTSWVNIAIRIAMLCSIFVELPANLMPLDIVVATGNFAAPMAVWYARQMGLPIGNIICSHNHPCVWNLLHQGEVRGDEHLPENLERLITATLGVEENQRFCEIVEGGRLYTTRMGMLEPLRKGMYATVTSQDRVNSVISSVYRMANYVMGPQTALAFSGLQDYRAKTGGVRNALLLAERSPSTDIKAIAASMEMSEYHLREILGV